MSADKPSMSAYYADRRRAASAWRYYLIGDHLPDQGHEGMTEILDSAKEEGRLVKQLLAIMQVARDVIPQLHTPAYSELFYVKGLEFAAAEAAALTAEAEADKADGD